MSPAFFSLFGTHTYTCTHTTHEQHKSGPRNWPLVQAFSTTRLGTLREMESYRGQMPPYAPPREMLT